MNETEREMEQPEPRPSPGTDPTNPFRQEAAGIWVPNERANERRSDEVGLTDRDREERVSGGIVPNQAPPKG